MTYLSSFQLSYQLYSKGCFDSSGSLLEKFDILSKEQNKGFVCQLIINMLIDDGARNRGRRNNIIYLILIIQDLISEKTSPPQFCHCVCLTSADLLTTTYKNHDMKFQVRQEIDKFCIKIGKEIRELCVNQKKWTIHIF